MWHQTLTGNLFNEAGLPLGSFRCGKATNREAVMRDLEKHMQLIYHHDPTKPTAGNGSIKYLQDNSAKFAGKKVKRIAYVWELTAKGSQEQYVIAIMDTFTPDVKKIGVPVAAANVQFATKVNNVILASNVPGLQTGVLRTCNIEFWSKNYMAGTTNIVPGADGKKYDFCDVPSGSNLGYGSMQLHNYGEKQTIFAYNGFRNPAPDLGFGNSTLRKEITDWTFARNAQSYTKASLKIYAGF